MKNIHLFLDLYRPDPAGPGANSVTQVYVTEIKASLYMPLKTACACLNEIRYRCADNNWPLLDFQSEADAKYLPRCREWKSFRFTRMVIHNGEILQSSYYFSLIWQTLIFLAYFWFYETIFLEKKRKVKVGNVLVTNRPVYQRSLQLFSIDPVGFLQKNRFVNQKY